MLLLIFFFTFLISFFVYQHIDYLRNNTSERQDIYIRYKENKISYSELKQQLNNFNNQFKN